MDDDCEAGAPYAFSDGASQTSAVDQRRRTADRQHTSAPGLSNPSHIIARVMAGKNKMWRDVKACFGTEAEDAQSLINEALGVVHATDDEECSNADDSARVDGWAAKRSFRDWKDWDSFCERVRKGRATPSCVIDFPFQDFGGDGHCLNLEGDERLVERMYCFHDPDDKSPGEQMVAIHVHTLQKWGQRTPGASLTEVTSVNARHAVKTQRRIDENDGGAYTQKQFVQEYGREDGMSRWNSSRPSFEQEVRKYYVVPKSKELTEKGAWQKLYRAGKANELVWKPSQKDSMPPLDRKGSKLWMGNYDQLREAIKAGEKLCRGAIVTYCKQETENVMRGGKSVRTEYEIVGVAVRAKVCPQCCNKTVLCAIVHQVYIRCT